MRCPSTMTEPPGGADGSSIDSADPMLPYGANPLSRYVAADLYPPARRATALGLSSPRSLQVSTPEQVLAGADELGYPLVVKPLASWRSLPST